MAQNKMESRQEHRARDERLDQQIERLLAGTLNSDGPVSNGEQVAREFARLASEESPRMSNAARAQGMNALRAAAAQKRAAQRPNPFAFLLAVPRWALVAAVALVVVLIANGVSTAAADALPGSLLYPFKRIGEGGQLFLRNTNGQRAMLWMNLANTRLDEVQRLLQSGARVDPSYVDAVDESILRALAELSGTPRQERVALLQQLTALAIRQQDIVNQLAQSASPADRARLEQTARLLQGVAGYAQSPDAASEVNPFQFLTPSPTPTQTLTPLPTQTPVPTNTAVPTVVATVVPTAVPPTVPVIVGDNNNANDNASTGNDNNDDDDNDNDDDNGNDNDDDDNDNDDNGNDNDDDNDNDDNGNDNDDDDNDDDDDDNSGSGGGGGDNDDDADDGNSGPGGGGGGDGGGDDDDDDDDNSGKGGDNDDDDDNSGKGGDDDDDDDNSGKGGDNDDDDDDNSRKGGGDDKD